MILGKITRENDPRSRTLRACLQVAFFVTTLMCLGAIYAANSFLSALAVIPAFALTLFPISNFVLIFWILANPEVRRTLAGRVLVNSTTYANRPLCQDPDPDDLALSVTVQVPVYTESFATIRETIDHALKAVNVYNGVSRRKANVIISDDALMIWANNDLPGFLDRARARQAEERTEPENNVIERVDFYRRHNLAFVARPRPVVGHDFTLRRGRFKKAGNLNKTIQIAESTAAYQSKQGLDYDDALQQTLRESRFRWTHAEGDISLGEIILMLDKDSITPPDALTLTIPEFVRDGRLAYTQHKTVATNDGENYFTGIMGVFTRLVFRLVFPAKAIQGWMPPFMGHNGFVRKSVLAESGYWSEDRVGEDLDFTMWAVASGCRGKFIAFEGAVFGEQVTRTYSEESGKYNRYGFSILELILNPVSGWLKHGLFTDRFNRYMRSGALGWEHKLDLMVVYPLFYINLALIPLMTVFVPYVGANVLVYAIIFFLSLAPPLLLASQQEDPENSGLGRRLFQFQALGFLFISFGFSILRGFASFFAGSSRLQFTVTSVDSLDDDLSPAEVLGGMTPQLRMAGTMLTLVSLSFLWAHHVDVLAWSHVLAASPVLVAVALFPFLMSPALLGACRRSLSA